MEVVVLQALARSVLSPGKQLGLRRLRCTYGALCLYVATLSPSFRISLAPCLEDPVPQCGPASGLSTYSLFFFPSPVFVLVAVSAKALETVRPCFELCGKKLFCRASTAEVHSHRSLDLPATGFIHTCGVLDRFISLVCFSRKLWKPVILLIRGGN